MDAAKQRGHSASDVSAAAGLTPFDNARDHETLAAILNLLRERIGIDFHNYRRATVARRIRNRMVMVGAVTLDAYCTLLRYDDAEPGRLAERISIKVSRFYRNAHAFDFIRRAVLPQLSARSRHQPLRLWSVGCGYGEEPYTLAMLLDEAGLDGTVDATDIDPTALAAAENGVYPHEAVTELPLDLAARYLVPATLGKRDAVRVDASLRERVRFARHDLTAGAPLEGQPRCDLVMCRNVLIYFGRAAQDQAFNTIVEQVRAGGFVCLGEAEWPLPSCAPALLPAYGKGRIFQLTSARREEVV